MQATFTMKKYQQRSKNTRMMKKRKRPNEHSRKRSNSREKEEQMT
jgi:hypothetical protein